MASPHIKQLKFTGTPQNGDVLKIVGGKVVLGSSDTTPLILPSGTDATRPASPVAGMMRLSTTSSSVEVYVSGAWKAVGTGTSSGSSTLAGLTDVNLGTLDTIVDDGVTMQWSGSSSKWLKGPVLGSAATAQVTSFATAGQGALADTALQVYGTTSTADDGKVLVFDGTVLRWKAGVKLGTAATANTTQFATAAQGSKADTAIQPNTADIIPELMLAPAVRTKLNQQTNANLTATRDPTAQDDGVGTAGSGTYQVGSLWINTATDKAFRCVQATTNNAVWVNTTLSTTDLGTAATMNATDFASAAQGLKADTALQPASVGSMAYQQASAVNITGGTIKGLPIPTADFDVAVKKYVDDQITARLAVANEVNIYSFRVVYASGVPSSVTNLPTGWSLGTISSSQYYVMINHNVTGKKVVGVTWAAEKDASSEGMDLGRKANGSVKFDDQIGWKRHKTLQNFTVYGIDSNNMGPLPSNSSYVDFYVWFR